MSILKGLAFGLQGGIDQGMTKVFGSALKGAGGFVTNSFKGATGATINLANKGALGSVTSVLGYGVGGTARAITKPFYHAGSTVLNPKNLKVGDWLAHQGRGLKSSTKNIMKMATKEVSEDVGELGIGLFGRAVNPAVGWGITGAAALAGVGNGYKTYNYNYGLKSLSNGIMDTEGVAITPGSVNASFTPVYSKGKKINNRGASGDLGFALHDSRNTGQF